MCNMPDGGRILYQCREVALIQCNETYSVHTGDPVAAPLTFDNPLAAWACFIDMVDARVRRRIGDMLEKQGRNRYTGELEKIAQADT